MTMFHTTAPFWEVWRTWFLSDGVGIVVVAPFVVGLGQCWRDLPRRGELIEGGAILGLLVLTSIYILSQPTTSWVSFSPGALVLPMLLWLAARAHPTLTTAGAFVVSSAAICATIFGLGRFGDAAIPILERVKGAQVAATMVTAYTLVLAALFTERRQRERALKMALDGAELGAFSADLATGYLECDARAARMHGHSGPPITIKESRRFVHPADLIRIDAALAEGTAHRRRLERRIPGGAPLDHPHAGETRWVAVESSIIRDIHGTPVGLLGVTRDITERKRADAGARRAQAQFDAAHKAARVGCYTYDTCKRRREFLARQHAIHGLSQRAPWKSPPAMVRCACIEDDQAAAARGTNRAVQGTATEVISFEFRIVRPGGEVRWIEGRSLISTAAPVAPSA